MRCNDLRIAAQLKAVPIVLPLAIAQKDKPFAHALWRYKNFQSDDQRQISSSQLGTLLSRGIHHASCLEKAAGVQFSTATWVPSVREGVHPLEVLLRECPSQRLQSLLRPCLQSTGNLRNPHEFSREKFAATADVLGSDILLIDDTWTTGANLYSAAAALEAAGAASIHYLVLGRHLDPSFDRVDLYLEKAAKLAFDDRFCAICDTRSIDEQDMRQWNSRRNSGHE